MRRREETRDEEVEFLSVEPEASPAPPAEPPGASPIPPEIEPQPPAAPPMPENVTLPMAAIAEIVRQIQSTSQAMWRSKSGLIRDQKRKPENYPVRREGRRLAEALGHRLADTWTETTKPDGSLPDEHRNREMWRNRCINPGCRATITVRWHRRLMNDPLNQSPFPEMAGECLTQPCFREIKRIVPTGVPDEDMPVAS